MWGEGWGCLCVLTTVNLTADPFTVTILVFCCHDQMEEVNNTQAQGSSTRRHGTTHNIHLLSCY